MNTLPAIDDLWDFGDPAATEGRFRAFLHECDDESLRAEALTQIARSMGLRKMFDEAHGTLDLVSESLPRVAPRVEVCYLLERGRTWNSGGSREKAREVFYHAFDAAKRVGDDYLTVDAAHMLGIVEDQEKAIEWNLLGLRILEQSKQEKAKSWIGALSNNLAWTYHERGGFESALGYFEKGLAYREEAGKEPELRIAKWAVARCKRSLGRTEEALREQTAIKESYFPAFDPLDEAIARGSFDGYLAEEIAECLLALGRAEESRAYFRAAHAALSNDHSLSANEPARVARLKTLAT